MMTSAFRYAQSLLFGMAILLVAPRTLGSEDCKASALAQISVDSGHPWRPPFGIDRVGAMPVVHVQLGAEPAPGRNFVLAAFRDGREIERQALTFIGNGLNPFRPAEGKGPAVFANVRLTAIPQQVALLTSCPGRRQWTEMARQVIAWPAFEADAHARPERLINPVDLGAIFVPHDWLLLTNGQAALVTVAAIVRDRDIPNARLRVAFEGSSPMESRIRLSRGKSVKKQLRVPLTAMSDRNRLQISLWDGPRELWKREIRTMVASAPQWPAFGAVEAKLRYDAPILRHDARTAQKLPAIDYDTAWDPKLNDVVVFLPNGSRFVFWRGSSYAPFWASAHHTGVNYQWAEDLNHRTSHPQHPNTITDFPEPMFDSELRYSRVEVVASTRSRVHVRWTYQPTTIYYDTRGEQVTEDFYFYPDGFGTRHLTLSSPIEERENFQRSEFLILAPKSAFPLDILPERLVDVLSLNGRTASYSVATAGGQSGVVTFADASLRPAVYKVFAHKEDQEPVIYFPPHQTSDFLSLAPFMDRGEAVAPVYWGGYWPLARGEATSWGINDRIFETPSFSSIGGCLKETPAYVAEHSTLDALGHAREMVTQSWYWLIAKTNASDDLLRAWARSFLSPPSLEVSGALLDFPSYSPERRSMRLIVEQPSLQIRFKPALVTMNPVFEFSAAQGITLGQKIRITIDGKSLAPDDYAWDGQILWMRASVPTAGAEVKIDFQ